MKNVDGRFLLKRLQNGEFQLATDNDIKEFLSVYSRDGSSVTEKERSLALKFLLAYNAKFDSLPSECLASAADTMVLCIRCCQFQKFDDPLFLIKVVYHLISKYGKLVHLREMLLLAGCIYEEYVFQRDNASSEETAGSVAQMALGLNIVLQNACVKMEQLLQNDQQLIVFNSRILGLQFLVFSRKTLATFAHKLLSVFEKAPASVVADIKPRLDSFLGILCRELSRDINNKDTLSGIKSIYTVELYCCIFHYLLRINAYQLARETVAQMRKHLVTQELSALWEKSNQDALHLTADVLERIVQNKEAVADHRTLKECVVILDQIARMDGLSYAVVHIASLVCDICLSITDCMEQKKITNFDEQDLAASFGFMDCQFTFYLAEWRLLKTEENEVVETHRKLQLDLMMKLSSIKISKLRTVLYLIHLNKSGISQFTDDCVAELKELETLLNKFAKETKIIIPYSERLSLGKVSYKWGSQLWFTGQYASAIDVLLVSARQFKICAAAENNLNTQIPICKVYDLLANCYRKTGHTKEALAAVVDSLLADADNLASAAKLWVKIHTDLANNISGGEISVQSRTLASALKECMAKDGKVFNPVVILQEELKASKSARTSAHAYYQKILEELIFSVKDDPVLKASVLLEKAFFVRSQKADGLCSAKLLCQEAIEILESIRDRRVNAQDLLAQAHICLYAINEPDQLDELLKGNSQNKVPKSDPAPQTALNDEDEENEDESFVESSKAVWYTDNLKLLRRALELWEGLFGQEDMARKAPEDVLDAGITLEYMQIMAVIFKLMQNFVSLSRSLILLMRLSSKLKVYRCQLWVFREQVEMYVALRQPAASEQVFADVDSWAAQDNVSLEQFGRLYIEYLLAKVETYLVIGKVKEATSVLAEAKEIKLRQFKEKTKDFLIVSGIIMMTESKMAVLPLEQLQGLRDECLVKNQILETQLETAVRGMRFFISTIFFLFQERNVSGSDALIDRWAVLDLLVRSLIYAGKCYLRTGDGREAKFYLQQGLRFCEAFCLRKRFCEFHLVLAQLSTFSDRFDDCDAHLYRVWTLLSADEKKVSGKQLSILSPNVSSRCKPTEVQEDDNDDFLKTKLLKLNMQIVKKNELGSSPPPKAQEMVLPKSWDHEVGCDCAQCTDLPLQILWMSFMITETYDSVRQRKQDCIKLAQHILKNHKKLELQALHVIAKFQLGRPQDNGSRDKMPVVKKVAGKRLNKKALALSDAISKFYNPELVRIHLLLSESALIDHDTLALNEHLNVVFKLLNEGHLPGCDNKSVLRAQALYLCSLLTFSWPKTDEMAAISQIDWICSGIGRKKVEEDISAGKIVAKTPKPSRRGRSSNKMPISPVADDLAGSALPQAPMKKKAVDLAVKAVPSAPFKRKSKQVSWKSEKELAEIPRMSCVVERSVSRAVEKLSLDDLPSADDSGALQLSTVRYCRGDNVSSSPTQDLLDAFYLLHRDPSTFLFRQISHCLAVSSMKELDSMATAFYLSEAQAVAFRHNCQVIVSKKLSKISDGSSEDSASGLVSSVCDPSATRRRLTELKAMMMFGRTKDDFEKNFDMMPEDWAVCQLSVIKPVGQGVGKLYATRFQQGSKPVTVNLPGYSSSEGQKLLAEFELIMKENQNSMLISQKAEWWKLRQKLDERLQDLLMNLEEQWLGCWRGTMLGLLTDDDDKKRLRSAATKFLAKIGHPSGDEHLVECLLSAAHLMSDRDIIHALRVIVDADLDVDIIRRQLEIVQRLAKELNLGICNRGCVTLILDKDVQHLPWESLPFLESLSVTRLPSIHFLLAHLKFLKNDAASVVNVGVDREKTFYVVNPDQNLSTTQQTFEDWFQSLPGWTGVVARQPTADELSTALTTKDLYVYCGHGSGNRYFSNESLQMLLCRPTVLLMGCSSGRLPSAGDFEASGVMLSYCLAGCPCIVGNLWDVTDRDIDRYLESLLKTWFSRDTTDNLVDIRQSSRLACRFKYLIGAAPVIYGFPVHIRRK